VVGALLGKVAAILAQTSRPEEVAWSTWTGSLSTQP
jgi:hypothetical protein